VSKPYSFEFSSPEEFTGFFCTSSNMTHAEIWDDTTLVDSWNEALEEYKVRNLVK
jgi:hypothetical protein